MICNFENFIPIDDNLSESCDIIWEKNGVFNKKTDLIDTELNFGKF